MSDWWTADPIAQPAAQPAGNWWANDPIANEDRRAPDAVTQSASGRTRVTVTPAQPAPEPTTTPTQRLAIDFENARSGPMQGSSPHTEQYGYPLATEVHENDAGDILFRDPQTGQLVQTDQSKHVVLTDAVDGRQKVYGRSQATDENAAVGVARVLSQGFLAGAPTARAAQGAVSAAQPLTEGQSAVAAANRLSGSGVPVQIPRAVASDNVVVQQGASIASNAPWAGAPLVRANENLISQLGSKADEVATGFAGSGNVPSNVTAGEGVKSGIANWITGKSADQAAKLYGRVDELVNPATRVQLDKTTEAASTILAQRTAEKTAGTGRAVDMIADAIKAPEGLTYQGIKGLRTRIGEMLDNGILPDGVSGNELRQIYKGLTADLGAAVRTAGGTEARAAWERANHYYRLASERRAALAKVVGASDDAQPEKVLARIIDMAGSSAKADVTKLAQVRKTVGSENWDDFVSSAVSRLGRDADGNFSPTRFITDYGKLSLQGKSVLFRSTGRGDLAQHLDDIAEVSRQFKGSQRFQNWSGTTRNMTGIAQVMGAFTDPLSTIGSTIGVRALSLALAKPASAAAISRWSRTYQALATKPTPGRLAALNAASRNLINNLDGVSVSPADFLRAIQGHVPARADRDE